MGILESAFDLPAGRLLALDLGLVRHGVAACDETGSLARPLEVFRRRRTRLEDFTALQTLVAREHASGVLIGLPLGAGCAYSEQARWVVRYSRQLAGYLAVPVAFWDESLSTHDAGMLVGQRPRRSLDAVAAALVLQEFLDVRRARRPQEVA
jgi:putative holliday junction resolvase